MSSQSYTRISSRQRCKHGTAQHVNGMIMVEVSDFVIVGTGAAGSTLAYCLGELSSATISILETTRVPPGRGGNPVLMERAPAHGAELGVQQPAATRPGNRQVYSAADQATGGGSVVYHTMYVRARLWISTTGPTTVARDGRSSMRFYQRSENQLDDITPPRQDCPLTIINARDLGNPVSQAFIDACVELGYPLVDDFNALSFGLGGTVSTSRTRNGCVLTSYLQPALTQGARHPEDPRPCDETRVGERALRQRRICPGWAPRHRPCQTRSRRLCWHDRITEAPDAVRSATRGPRAARYPGDHGPSRGREELP